ncbi:HupE/UreJ family protein [Formosa sediminum]|uniref:HupE/UreJ family protein n=1 Tax=Formosa sediminum TaxID=2594004 RepID=A0A516GNF5_9FLAO|nr:HupE/UreJ family protein [Formosa sediminum]QDO93025.1 HupE/UreJ family protein [Formosa sediminum]
MLDDFLFYVQYGINHVLDINGYDHVLFLLVLTVAYVFKDWKRVLILVSLFTLGHTISLVLAAYDIVKINGALVELLIPITIFVMALFNIFTAGKTNQKGVGLLFFSALFFGIIHGLGFAREFHLLIGGSSNKLLPLLEFALGIEAAQIIIVFVVLFFSFLMQTVFNFSKRDWVLVMSAIVMGLVIPMIIENELIA